MPTKFNELLLRPDIEELYQNGVTPDYGYLLNGRFEKDMIKTLYPLKTLSGNPITWEASDTEYLFPVISLAPKQAGSGDPSPDNVRPISGRDSVQVTRCGKNLLDYSQLAANTTNYGLTSEKAENNCIRVSGTASQTGDKLSFSVCHTSQSGLSGKGYSVFPIPVSGCENLVNAYGLRTSEENAIAITARLTNGESYDMLFQLMITADNSTPTAYEPYQGDTYTLTLPETIYGGTVDAVTGVGSKEWEYYEITGEELWQVGSDNLTNVYRYFFAPPQTTIFGRAMEGYCNVYKTLSSITTDEAGVIFGHDNFNIYLYLPKTDYPDVTSVKSYLATQYSAGTPVTICYKLATPGPFQATGNQQLTSLVGYNTIYTNGDSMILNRKARRLEV